MTKVTLQNSGRKKVFSVSALGHLDINVRGRKRNLTPTSHHAQIVIPGGNWRELIWCSLLGRLDIVKMSVFLNVTFRFKAIPIKIQVSYLVDIDKLIQKFIWRCKRPRIAKKILKEKNRVGRLMLPKFKTYYNAIITNTTQYWWKNRQIN